MWKQLATICLCFITSTSFSQLNLDSIGHIDLNTLHDQRLNDIWGYTDEQGNEYALVGGTKGTSVVDISDPTNPTEIFWESGMESVWRDLKTVGDYAYVTTEATNGLLIIDLSPLPQSTNLPVSYYYGSAQGIWSSAHNLYANDDGYVYIFGSNRGNGGVIILDVATDPMNPIEVGEFDDWYVHDGYVENNTMYLGHINEGFFSIVDVTDKANPVLLGTQTTPNTFTHNIWTKAGGDYAFTTDEVSGAYIGAYDISDPTNIVEVDRIQSTPGAGIIPHNAHVLGDFIITSYYSDGVVVHDATYPYNLIEVANYDTYPFQTTGYDGCWGVYPFFSSGLMVASDRDYGMYVLSPGYSQASYLEGIVTDVQSSTPIADVLVEISGSNQIENTSTAGFYATGMAAGGNYDVTFNKIGYYPETVPVTLVNGQITVQDVQLIPIPPFTLDITVLETGTNNPIDNVEIRLEGSLSDFLGTTNALGEESMTLYYEETYKVYVGKWGYVTHCEWIDIDANTGSLVVHLEPGYYDDFAFDFNWVTVGTAGGTGLWERAIPFGTISSPGVDSDQDCSQYCYITENATTQDYAIGTVNNGTVLLLSPTIDLTGFTDPYVHYERWFYCDFGTVVPGDSLEILMANGTVTERIDVQLRDTATHGFWIEKDIRILDYLSLSSNMQLLVRTSDYPPEVNVTEAAFDNFYITEAEFVNVPEHKNNEWQLQPNPSSGIIQVAHLKTSGTYEVRSIGGKFIQSGRINPGGTIDGSQWESGVYFIKIEDKVQKIVIAR